jgi:hypothetical protein
MLGSARELTTEQLEWVVEVERRLEESKPDEASEALVESSEAALRLTDAGA